jgi:hypothetical protein
MLTHLTCGVNDLGCEICSSVSYYFTECILDCGIVAFDKVAVDVLDCEGRFAYLIWSTSVPMLHQNLRNFEVKRAEWFWQV